MDVVVEMEFAVAAEGGGSGKDGEAVFAEAALGEEGFRDEQGR